MWEVPPLISDETKRYARHTPEAELGRGHPARRSQAINDVNRSKMAKHSLRLFPLPPAPFRSRSRIACTTHGRYQYTSSHHMSLYTFICLTVSGWGVDAVGVDSDAGVLLPPISSGLCWLLVKAPGEPMPRVGTSELLDDDDDMSNPSLGDTGRNSYLRDCS